MQTACACIAAARQPVGVPINGTLDTCTWGKFTVEGRHWTHNEVTDTYSFMSCSSQTPPHSAHMQVKMHADTVRVEDHIKLEHMSKLMEGWRDAGGEMPRSVFM